jgi:SAM-dependent methyltransferase
METEQDLAALCGALVGNVRLPLAERQLVRPSIKFSAQTLKEVRAAIRAGEDPLGDAFCRIRSPGLRRGQGAIYTPKVIVDTMLAWAVEQAAPPRRIVDPGSGSGRFLAAAAKAFPNAELIAVEIDPFAALMTRATATVLGFAKRLTVERIDYRQLRLPAIDRQTLFIGNPPYVRHHGIEATWKTWFAESAARAGIQASKLAGLHIHFFFKTLELASSGDIGVFVTAAEWLDVNYGSALRELLADGLGGTALHVLDPAAMPFTDAATTGAITCFLVGKRPQSLRVRTVPALVELNGLSTGTPVPWETVVKAKRWSTILRPASDKPIGYIELGELFRVSRGQVTGGNRIWIEGPHTSGLPESVLLPTVTRARELLAAGDALTDASRLRRVLSLPIDLDELEPYYRKVAERFIKWAREQGAADSYIAQHRRAWWSVPLYEPAPIICTYMARRPPAFVRNLCDARILNIAHGLYPRQTIDAKAISRLLEYLRRHVGIAAGRTYAGGLTKFEPGELERIPVPALDTLRHAAASRLD